jgi:acetylornithine deacetylase/succinyl-diaminopimelate desuccinylase-like protein
MEERNLVYLRSLVKNYESGLISFCRDLIKTPSVNGQDNEGKISYLISMKAQKLGLPSKLFALEKDRPNIFIGKNFNQKSGLLLVAHLDTVPVGDKTKWKHSPFGGEIEDGKLYGRGAIDCKAGIALSIYTLKILSDLKKLELAKFAGVVDEESGASSKLGARFLLNKGLNAQVAIYTYPGVDTITIGHRGLVRFWVEVMGEAAHTGSKSWQEGIKGADAISALSEFINKLSKINLKGTHPLFPGYGFKQTPTLIEGGTGESIVPDKAKVLIDTRLLPNYDNVKYIQRINDLAQKMSKEKVKFEVKIKNNIPGVVISPKEKIVKIIKNLCWEILGIVPEVKGAGPANEGYMFIQAGIPMICGFGPEGDGVHSCDEYLKLDSLPKILEIYVRTALELFEV